MLPQFDIVNGGKCPFCGTDIVPKDVGQVLYDHCFCPGKCVKIMYDKLTKNWILIRIYFRDCDIEIHKFRGDHITFTDYITQDNMILPLFDVFSHSLQDLQNKVKTYLLFS